MIALKNTLYPLARAITDRKDGCAMVGYPLRRDLVASEDELVRTLTELVEELDSSLTLCSPADRLLYGYIQGSSVAVLLCQKGTPMPVADKTQVIKAWYVIDGGLLPAAFDCMPEAAYLYIEQMNGRH
jgi:hypothetical protein